MFERGIRGTGTTSDAVAIVSPLGPGTKYAGTATDVGIAIARAVRKATSESIRKWSLVNPPMDFLSLLERKGVTIDDLWAMGTELPRPDTSWDPEDLHRRFVHKLDMLKEDVNVNSLIQAALLMEAEAERDNIRGLRAGEFNDDPVNLVADKMMGVALVEYLAGKGGLKDYERYGETRPCTIKRLGPFLDDIVSALVLGTMSRICADRP